MTDVPTIPAASDPDEQTQSGAPEPTATSDVARRAREVESLPLSERADAFAGLHDELRTRLESGGTASA